MFEGLFASLKNDQDFIWDFAKALAYKPSERPYRSYFDVIITRLVCICEVIFIEPKGGKCALYSAFPLVYLTLYTGWPCSGLLMLCLCFPLTSDSSTSQDQGIRLFYCFSSLIGLSSVLSSSFRCQTRGQFGAVWVPERERDCRRDWGGGSELWITSSILWHV